MVSLLFFFVAFVLWVSVDKYHFGDFFDADTSYSSNLLRTTFPIQPTKQSLEGNISSITADVGQSRLGYSRCRRTAHPAPLPPPPRPPRNDGMNRQYGTPQVWYALLEKISWQVIKPLKSLFWFFFSREGGIQDA